MALAPGIGAGICAFIFFVFRRPLFTVEFAFVVVTAVLFWLRWLNFRDGFGGSAQSVALLGLVLPAAAVACAAMLIRVYRMPHGNWDGWAIWNWEARFLYRAGPHWRDYLPWAYHGDYPLLVPSTTARIWRYMGTELPDVGGTLGVVLSLASVAVLGLTLAELRSRTLGALVALTLICTPSYLNWASSQYADVPLGFYFLSSLALISFYFERSGDPQASRILGLAGFLAGCAAWTKNEGILLVIGAGTALSMSAFRKPAETWQRIRVFSMGGALPLAVLLFFKLTNTVGNYVVAYHEGKLQKVLDLSRHATILRYVGHNIVSFGAWSLSPLLPLLAFILLIGVHRPIFASDGWRTIATAMLIVVAGYYFVYLTTPIDLKWHIETSMDRLFIQLWPSILLIAGLMCKPARAYASD
jgi:hypothetical protein